MEINVGAAEQQPYEIVAWAVVRKGKVVRQLLGTDEQEVRSWLAPCSDDQVVPLYVAKEE